MSHLKHDGGGWASVQCDRCGYYNSWEWNADENDFPESGIPGLCPDCEQGPVMKRLWARYQHGKAMRRLPGQVFIPEIWAKEPKESIEFMKTLTQEQESPTYD